MRQPIINEDDEDMAEIEDDSISKLLIKLNKLHKRPIELQWKLKVFGIECYVRLYI